MGILEERVEKVSLEDILRMDAGSVYTYDSSAGERYERWEVTIHTKDGRKIELPTYYECHEYGSNHDPNWEDGERKTIAEVLPEYGIKPEDIERVVVYERYYCSWEDYGDREELITYIPEGTLDIEKLREEIIERVRSMNEDQILQLYFTCF